MSKQVTLNVVKLNDTLIPMKHQQKVVDFITNDKNKAILVYHSVGLGKTYTSLFAAKSIIENNKNKHVIIATPASLVSNFEKSVDNLGLSFKNKIKIESYQKLSRYFSKHGYGICLNAVLIIDESHNLNGGGIIFNHFFECAKKAYKVILLSGTLVKNSPGEISKQLSLLEGIKVNNTIIDSMTNIADDKRRRRLFSQFFKCKISIVNKQEDDNHYPTVKQHVVDLKMTKKYYDEYYNIQEDIRSDLPDFLENTKNITVFLNGIRRATNKTKTLSPKIKWIIQKIVKDYNDGKKILIYSNWIDTGIVILKQILTSEKIKFSSVIGGMTKKEKDLNIKNYNDGKTKIMLISASGSEGLDLKETRTVIIMEPYWNKTRILQVIGRASRYNSHAKLPEDKRIVDVYHLILSKPDKKDREYGDNIESADDILWGKSEDKQDFINVFYDTLEKISIEKDPSCFAK